METILPQSSDYSHNIDGTTYFLIVNWKDNPFAFLLEMSEHANALSFRLMLK